MTYVLLLIAEASYFTADITPSTQSFLIITLKDVEKILSTKYLVDACFLDKYVYVLAIISNRF